MKYKKAAGASTDLKSRKTTLTVQINGYNTGVCLKIVKELKVKFPIRLSQ
jgi:hypothetical protein